MADIDKRLRYFNGQFLEQQDFRDEQDYHLDRQRRHNRIFHTYGIAEGLTVNAPAGAGEITVAIGTAVDGLGRQIVLPIQRTLPLGSSSGKTVLVVISYDELGVLPAQVGKQGEMTRWEEHPKVELVEEGDAETEDVQIRLGRVVVAPGGTVTSFDAGVRQIAGPRLNAGVVTGAALADGAVTANKIADGSVTPNKIAANAVRNAAISDNSVTTTKIADLGVTTAKIADLGVTTGKIADLGVTTAKIADLGVATAKIADLGVTAAKIANNAVTTAKIADLNVTTVKIADANVTGPKIADGTINEVKLDPATRAKLGGGLSSGGTINGVLSVLGGLNVGGPIGGFGLDQMFAATLPFTSTNGDGTITSLSIGFIPRLILLTGGMSGRFDPNGVDNRFGGMISGFAFQTVTLTGGGVDTSLREAAAATQEVSSTPAPDPSPPPPRAPSNTITQLCHGPSITRSSAGLVRQDIGNFAAIAGATFLNRGVSPVQGASISLSVTEMIPRSVTFRLSRALPTGASSVLDVESFSFNVIILGHLDTNTF